MENKYHKEIVDAFKRASNDDTYRNEYEASAGDKANDDTLFCLRNKEGITEGYFCGSPSAVAVGLIVLMENDQNLAEIVTMAANYYHTGAGGMSIKKSNDKNVN
jgi:hypothetical protein